MNYNYMIIEWNPSIGAAENPRFFEDFSDAKQELLKDAEGGNYWPSNLLVLAKILSPCPDSEIEKRGAGEIEAGCILQIAPAYENRIENEIKIIRPMDQKEAKEILGIL